MDIAIRKCLGVSELDLNLGGFDILYGPNGSGKTSVLNAIRACLSDGNPLGLNAASMKAYRHNGEAGGFVEANTSSGRTRWMVSGSHESLGDRPYASQAALGMVDLLTPTTPARRLAAWQEVVNLKEEAAVIQAKLKHLPKAEAESIARDVERHGWDRMLGEATERLRSFKRQWEQNVANCDGTSVRWGSKSFKVWRPEGWDERTTLTDAKEAAAEARLAVSGFEEAARAASQDEEEVKRVRDRITELNEDIAKRKESLNLKEKDHFSLTQTYESWMLRNPKPIQPGAEGKPYRKCDYCDKAIGTIAGKTRALSKSEFESLKDHAENQEQMRKEAAEQLEEWKGKHAKACAGRDQAAKDYQSMKAEINRMEGELESLQARNAEFGDAPDFDPAQLNQAREELVRCERRQLMAETMEKMKSLYRAIDTAITTCDQLGPDGIRRELRQERMGGIVSRLRDINELAEWGDTELNPETLEIVFDTRPVQICSRSERWRADAALRLAIALEDESMLWLADDANHLDVPNLKALNGLLGKLRSQSSLGYLLAFVGPESAVTRLFDNGEARAV